MKSYNEKLQEWMALAVAKKNFEAVYYLRKEYLRNKIFRSSSILILGDKRRVCQ